VHRTHYRFCFFLLSAFGSVQAQIDSIPLASDNAKENVSVRRVLCLKLFFLINDTIIMQSLNIENNILTHPSIMLIILMLLAINNFNVVVTKNAWIWSALHWSRKS